MATNSVDTKVKEQAMDFFLGLDPNRYVAFKTSMLNGWAAGAFDPPDTVNKIYRSWQAARSSQYLMVKEEQ
jgi:hypothetical protein